MSTASEPDSLSEKEPMEKLKVDSNFVRGQRNYTTFTRQRPTNLNRNNARCHRQSLLSPQSVDNLDTDVAQTPDFAMTQSMYEPNGRKDQIEKMNQQSKLMNLIASEKATHAAQKRKIKEMKNKVVEQKKKNDERQKIVEERRIRMLADEEERRRKIMSKMEKSNNVTNSYYGNMTQSITWKNNSGTKSKFLANRPMSSTGKVFGFGSSAPRDTCDTIKQEKPNINNSCSLDMSKDTLPLSRMCTSQIMNRSTQPEFRGRLDRNSFASISKSEFKICGEKKLRLNNESVLSTSVINTNKVPRATPKSIKSLNSTKKIEVISRKVTEAPPRSRSATRDINLSKPTEKQLTSPIKSRPSKSHATIERDQKSILRNDDNKINTKSERASSAGNKKRICDNRHSIMLESDGECEKKVENKPEVRFNTDAEVPDKSDKENADRIVEKATKVSTNDDYKQRMALQRKLAKEKKIIQESEREKEKQNFESISDQLTPVDTSITTESEISINILPKDDDMTEAHMAEPISQFVACNEKSDDNCKDLSNECGTSVPDIEVSNEKDEMTASTDELDRLERKKRIESIMSRIKKTPSGSTENLNQHMTTSALQNMMDKGHLSGMSKTAAVLMRNAHRSTDLSSSTSDLQVPSGSMKILVNCEDNSVAVSRGDCDGREDSPKEVNPTLETKSNLLQNMSSNIDGSYFTSWKEKYSASESLDSENDNTEGN